MPMNMTQRAAAMRDVLLGCVAECGLSKLRIMSDERLAAIAAYRDALRVGDGGGGLCHLMTEAMQHKAPKAYGRVGVSYLSPQGEVICAGHYVCFLADATIIDPTADQMGEGRSVAVVRPDDPEYGRYRPEFDQDWNPENTPRIAAFSSDWHGEDDSAMEHRLRSERGAGWWLPDKTAYRNYWSMQKDIASAYYIAVCDSRLASLDIDTAAFAL